MNERTAETTFVSLPAGTDVLTQTGNRSRRASIFFQFEVGVEQTAVTAAATLSFFISFPSHPLSGMSDSSLSDIEKYGTCSEAQDTHRNRTQTAK